MEKDKFTRRLGAFTSATFLSRILGYVRDALIAAHFGGGALTDAYFAAFRVPNLFRRFLGEGAMTAAFVPIFTDIKTKKGKDEATRFLGALFSGLIIALVVIVGLGMIFAPAVAKSVAWGFVRNPEKFALTVDLVRLIFPFLLLISLAALVTAALNSCGRFFVPGLAPAGLSLSIIVYLVFFSGWFEKPIYGLAIATVIGAGCHLLFQIPSLNKEGHPLRLQKPFSHPEIKTFFLLLAPTVLGLGADQINAFIDQICASFLKDGSITALYNSNRIMQLPLALFGIAVSSVALPALSKSMSLKKEEDFKDILNFSLRIANFVLIPSLIGLIVLGGPIVKFLFEHGKFTSEFSALTYTALVAYAIGLPGYSAAKILSSAFYARKNTQTPMRIALWAMVLHVAANLALMWRFEVAGLALSTALSGWFQAIFLAILIRKEVGPLGGRTVVSSFAYGAVAGCLMGGFCWVLLKTAFASISVMLSVPLSILLGVVFYLGVARIFHVKELSFLIETVRNRRIPLDKDL